MKEQWKPLLEQKRMVLSLVYEQEVGSSSSHLLHYRVCCFVKSDFVLGAYLNGETWKPPLTARLADRYEEDESIILTREEVAVANGNLTLNLYTYTAHDPELFEEHAGEKMRDTFRVSTKDFEEVCAGYRFLTNVYEIGRAHV